jgi:hypothetical protein
MIVYLVEGETIDTYGGDFTYHDLWYEEENGEKLFFETIYGQGAGEDKGTTMITDKEEIDEIKSEYNLN